MAHYFTPPTDRIVPATYMKGDDQLPVDPAMQKLFRFYRNGDRGRNIFLMSDGTYRDSQVDGQPPNMNPTSPTSPYATVYDGVTQTTSTFSNSVYVTKVYWGGCANPVTDAEVTALTAAGYGSYIT